MSGSYSPDLSHTGKISAVINVIGVTALAIFGPTLELGGLFVLLLTTIAAGSAVNGLYLAQIVGFSNQPEVQRSMLTAAGFAALAALAAITT